MKNTLIETLHILAGLAVAVAVTWAAAWSYPLGAEVIWWCGAAAMVATVLMGIAPLREGIRQDRVRNGARHGTQHETQHDTAQRMTR